MTNMWRAISAAALLMSMSGTVLAQAPTFDVASAKVYTGNLVGGYNAEVTPTSLTMRHVSMGFAIRYAYSITQAYDLSGPDGSPPPRSKSSTCREGQQPGPRIPAQLMLRTLLADRFGLTVHKETRNLPSYSLVIASPSQATPSPGEGDPKVKYTKTRRIPLHPSPHVPTRPTTRPTLDLPPGDRPQPD